MEKVSNLESGQSRDWLVKVYKKLVFGAFSSLKVGHITLVHGNDIVHFGDQHSQLKVQLTVNDPAMYKAFALSGSVGAGESYILGHWDCDNLTALIEIFAINQAELDAFEKKFAFFSNIYFRLNHFKNKNSQHGSKKNIVAHYDLGNDLYSSFFKHRDAVFMCCLPDKRRNP